MLLLQEIIIGGVNLWKPKTNINKLHSIFIIEYNMLCWKAINQIKSTVSIKERCPKMFLLFSRLIVEKIASFLTYLKSWWKVVLVFGKEHANWSDINGFMIGWSWKIKFGKIHFFVQNVNLKCQKHPFYGN